MLKDLEALLIELSSREDKKQDDRKAKILRLALEHKQAHDSQNWLSMFSKTLSDTEKRFYSACLIRMLCANDDAIWSDQDLRIKAFDLINSTMGNDYKVLGLSVDMPNHIKLSKLKEIEFRLVDDFTQIVKSATSLNLAIESQSKVMKLIHSPFNFLLLEQFADPALTSREAVGELYRQVRSYINSVGNSRLHAYKQFDSAFSDYFSKMSNCNAHIANVTIGSLFQTIYDLVKTDFGQCEIIQPASIELSPQHRNYPFHKKNVPVDLRLTLKNDGPGIASDIRVETLVCDGLDANFNEILSTEMKVESISFIVTAKSTDSNAGHPKSILFKWSWRNYDNKLEEREEIFEFASQRDDIEWDVLSLKRPYSLQAVRSESDLIGRRELIDKLFANLISDDIQSAIVFGQKRVGKTSIAKILSSKLAASEGILPIFIKVGDLDKTTPSKFIQSLGNSIVDGTKDSNDVLRLQLQDPEIGDVLSPPIARYFKRLQRDLPRQRYVIIIDEFDEIPSELYRYSELGNTFFHNIRALSQESGQIGFVLVGGENMQIIRQSTDRLNLFFPAGVDYFDKERYFDDFKELITHPTKDVLEFSSDAIDEIYKHSEGNPFYTKFICDQIFKEACDRKDAYVSLEDAQHAILMAIESLDIINMNHFWIDGSWGENDAKNDEVQTHRRKLLMAYASVRRNTGKVNRGDLLNSSYLQGVPGVALIENFKTRRIIVEENNDLRLKPLLFDKWLTQRGSDLLTSTFTNENAIREMQTREEKAFVTDREIAEVVKNWDLYRSTKIEFGHVRAWLDQFSNNIERRLMFALLEGVDFYGESRIREKLRIIHKRVREEMKFVIKEDERRTREILLSSFGKPSKSGSSYARMYASENGIISINVADMHNIAKVLQNDAAGRISTIVFVDDLIGSGGTAFEGLEQLNAHCGQVLVDKSIRIVVAAICGREEGRLDLIKRTTSALPFKTDVYLCDTIDQANECFSSQSKLFADESESARAKEIAYTYGVRLQKKHPLGYQGGELLVVFHDTCPNNSLPILWCYKENVWEPLFRRY